MKNLMKYQTEGAYGMLYERVLSIDAATGKGVLIEDVWCKGDGDGELYRPHLYYLTPDVAAAAREAWENTIPDDRPYLSTWDAFKVDFAGDLTGGELYYGKPEAALKDWVRHGENL